MSVRIATFNVENLMTRFDFSGWGEELRRDRALAGKRLTSQQEYRLIEQARVIAHEDDARQMTALAIADCDADIICLQEVENLETLEEFEENYLAPMTGMTYPHKVWIEGNDTRGIDVALMARNRVVSGEKIEITKVKSHHRLTCEELGVHTPDLARIGVEANERLFRRDCLEVNVRVGRKPVTFFVCHFKSMGPSKGGMTGRDYTRPLRMAEAKGVRTIIERKFGADRADKMRWMICGDLNDYSERIAISGSKAAGYTFETLKDDGLTLSSLLDPEFSEDLIGRRVRENRWTLHYATNPANIDIKSGEQMVNHLVQLDYLLASPAMARTNSDVVPDIIRNGLPHRTIFPAGQDVDRYPRTGWDRPKASDHCPVAVTLKIV